MKKLFITMFTVLIVLSMCGTAMADWQCWNAEDGCYPAAGNNYVQFTHLQIQIVAPDLTFATSAWTWDTGGANWTAVNNNKLVVVDGNTSAAATRVDYWLAFNGDEPAEVIGDTPIDRNVNKHMICSVWNADKSFIGAINFYGGEPYWGGGIWSLYTGPDLSYVEASSIVPELPGSTIVAGLMLLTPVRYMFRRKK